ncbi:MAG: OmpA family protein [Chitinophagales bacterium]
MKQTSFFFFRTKKNAAFLLVFMLLVANVFAQKTSTSLQEEQVTQQVLFSSDSYELNPQMQADLKTLAATIKTYPIYQLNLNAYTDSDGDNEYNIRLSKNRAEAVEHFLLQEGLFKQHISYNFFGENNPINDNSTDFDKQQNRRVEIVATCSYYQHISDVLQDFRKKKEQHFLVDAAINEVIEGKQGTKIRIPAGSFSFLDGKPANGLLTITLTEAYNNADIILQNLTTTSNGQLLETGGMINVQASSKGQELKLKPDAKLTVALPNKTAELAEGMELFYGDRTTDNDVMNWEATNIAYTNEFEENTIDWSKLQLDLSAFKAIDIDVPQRPTKPYFEPMANYPKKARKPITPRQPTKPTLEKTRVNTSWFKKMISSKQKLAKEKEVKFSEKMAVYETKYEKYLEKQAKYEKNLATYNADKENHQENISVWQKEYDSRVAIIHAFMNEFMDYNAALNAKVNIKKAINNFENRIFDFKVIENAVYNGNLVKDKPYLKQMLNEALNRQQPKRIGQESNAYAVSERTQSKLTALYHQYSVHDANKMVLNQLRAFKIENGSVTKGELNAYVFDITNLGWINCDRFYEYEGEKQIMVFNEQDRNTLIYLVCKELNSILPVRYNVNRKEYYTDKLPTNLEVKVVAIKMGGKGTIQLAMEDMQVSDIASHRLTYQSGAAKDMLDKLARL